VCTKCVHWWTINDILEVVVLKHFLNLIGNLTDLKN
jgi:hypothetical protein